MKSRIAIAGAGIYGATAAIRLAERGHSVAMYDPLGLIRAASAINAGRIHSGYHYPRSPETVAEVLEARGEFLQEFATAIVGHTRNYYAIPRAGSRVSTDEYKEAMGRSGLRLTSCRPDWLDFNYIEECYEVEEQIYDPQALRGVVQKRIESLGITFQQQAFCVEMRANFDYVIWATYGLSLGFKMFSGFKRQVAEKVVIELPIHLRHIALVIVDGPFTAFDPYGNSGLSQFGSAKYTNHWSTTDSTESIPRCYGPLLNKRAVKSVRCSRFKKMRADCALAVPDAKDAIYKGSRFTIRVVENNPEQDRRTLYIVKGDPNEFFIFSGKVVSAVKAARLICEAIEGGS